jgi:hypothetical protein
VNAFDLHDEYVRYQREGGRHSFTMWAGRYGDDYGCDGAWLAEDYLSAWRHHEDREPDVPMQTYRDWLASQQREYLEAHLDEVPEVPIQGRGVDLDRTEGDVGPIVAAADAGTGGHHADSRAAGVPDDGPVGHDHGGASSELEPAREGDRESDPPGTAPRHDAWWVVHADVLRSMLDRARAGEDPGVLYVELIANSESTS